MSHRRTTCLRLGGGPAIAHSIEAQTLAMRGQWHDEAYVWRDVISHIHDLAKKGDGAELRKCLMAAANMMGTTAAATTTATCTVACDQSRRAFVFAVPVSHGMDCYPSTPVASSVQSQHTQVRPQPA